MMYEPSELVRLSHEATKTFNRLCLTGITDRVSLVKAVARDMPNDVVLIDASTPQANYIMVRENNG